MKPRTLRYLILIACLTAVGGSAQEKKSATPPRPAKTEASFTLPDTVSVEKNIGYARYGTREVMLDMYLPKQRSASRIPSIVVVHGGGWKSGDKERFARHAAYLASKGFAAACIGYRLLPEVTVPECVQDCKAAVRWVRANAGLYGIDPDRIGTIGGSAGGHLVAMLGTSYKLTQLEGTGGSPGVSSRVQAVVAMAAPTDFSDSAEQRQWDRETALRVSPVIYVDRDSAPLLLLHGETDKSVPMIQSEILRDKYKKAGASVELIKNKGGHGFWMQEPGFTETMDRAVAFFREKLK